MKSLFLLEVDAVHRIVIIGQEFSISFIKFEIKPLNIHYVDVHLSPQTRFQSHSIMFKRTDR